ncbi:BspA family leucine-rich repeat surface protein [Lactiplantibacillus pentosus]|uniref:BspA family leucine-rich repeat surface protein n=1 Tax=Lactiplantibacillus pentosus TaxID=1589 RepID=UPI0040597F0A
MDGTFSDLPNVTTLPIASWKTSGVSTLRHAFNGSTGLTSLPIGGWDISNVFDMNGTFEGCTGLTSLPIGNWNTSSVLNLGSTFAGMTNLTSLPIDKWDTSKVSTMSGTFKNVPKMKTLPISSWKTSNVKTMAQLFAANPQFTSLPIDNWNTGSVTDLSEIFSGDSGLKELNLGAWNTANVVKFDQAFVGTQLDKLDLLGWNTASASSYTNTFSTKIAPKHLILGKNFKFFGSTAWNLTKPSEESPYVGRWRSLNNQKVYSSADLMTKYDGQSIVGEFVWATGNTITVKYVDAAGNSLAPDTKLSGVTGDAYHIKPIAIEGYTPDKPDGVQGTFTDKDETITLTYSTAGELMFVSAPKTIDFGENKITGKPENYGATYDTGLVVQDGRKLGSTWSLNATLAANGFTGAKSSRPLTATLSYKDQQTGNEAVLAPGVASAVISNHQTVSHQNVNVLGQSAALGSLYLKVPTDQALTDTYETTVTWTLGATVANR